MNSTNPPGAMPVSILRQHAASLPLEPGVYLFKNTEGEILYVGKAIRLRERVRSYFAKEIGRGPGIDQMVQEAVSLDHQTTGSEMEALLLEARLIRQYKPRYNIKLRDDKSFALIRIDMSDPFPPVYISREKELEELLARAKRQRAGLGRVSQKINSQEFFGPYLSAYAVRTALRSIRKIWPFRDSGPGKLDSFVRVEEGGDFATLHLSDTLHSRISQEEYRKNIDQIRAFLRGDRETVLRMVQEQMEQAALNERYEDAARYRDRLQSLLHLQEVAQTRRFVGRRASGSIPEYNPEEDIRLESYDISNNQGAYAVGSLITGIVRRGKVEPVQTKEEVRQRFYYDRSRYRKFRIKTVQGVSDTDMLQEVLTRRLKRAKGASDPKWSLPDMIMVDGGKGQLRVVQRIVGELEMEGRVGVGSVAKGPTRKRVDLYGTDYGKLPTVRPEAWRMLAELLREEAHRFAISYYRRTHRKGMLE